MPRIWTLSKPLIISAFFLSVISLATQYVAKAVSPSFNILASKGPGKILFILFFVSSAALCMWLTGAAELRQWRETVFKPLQSLQWLRSFSVFFFPFFIVHICIIALCVFLNYAHYDHIGWSTINWQWPARIALGFLATLLLTFGEEVLFRATLYNYIAQFISPWRALIATSLCFALAHDILAPWHLLTTQWRLGLGLFLLGLLLNVIYYKTNNLYNAIGAHAGLVFVKVILRRLPLITFTAQNNLFFCSDLRQSLVIHSLLLITLGIISYNDRLYKKAKLS